MLLQYYIRQLKYSYPIHYLLTRFPLDPPSRNSLTTAKLEHKISYIEKAIESFFISERKERDIQTLKIKNKKIKKRTISNIILK